MPPPPSTPVRSRHATHPAASSATTSATPPTTPAGTGSPLRLVPRGAASLRTPGRRPATVAAPPSSPAPSALELSGLSVSHELDLGSDSESEDGAEPSYEEASRSAGAGIESYELTPTAASAKGKKAKEREAYSGSGGGGTPQRASRLRSHQLAGPERQELERLRSMMLGRSGSTSPGEVTPPGGRGSGPQPPPSFERSEFETVRPPSTCFAPCQAKRTIT